MSATFRRGKGPGNWIRERISGSCFEPDCSPGVYGGRIPELAAQAQQTFAALELTNIEIRTGDGTLGWEEKAPFEAIVVTASGPDIPEPLKRQLTINGRLVMPVGSLHHGQQILRVTRTDDDAFTTEYLLQVAFVPLLGKFGWKEA
jgi:protein-L-isoaspartate(D-aspartate) O-methyltransferase